MPCCLAPVLRNRPERRVSDCVSRHPGVPHEKGTICVAHRVFHPRLSTGGKCILQILVARSTIFAIGSLAVSRLRGVGPVSREMNSGAVISQDPDLGRFTPPVEASQQRRFAVTSPSQAHLTAVMAPTSTFALITVEKEFGPIRCFTSLITPMTAYIAACTADDRPTFILH
jgi:hypothetical protein